jgi:hypothetical protein
MNQMKKKLELQLIANIIKDKCEKNSDLIFKASWSSKENIIRFTTPLLRKIFPPGKDRTGKWKTGDHAMYEVFNEVGSLYASLTVDVRAIPYNNLSSFHTAMEKATGNRTTTQAEILLKEWDLIKNAVNTTATLNAFDKFLAVDLPVFEAELTELFSKNISEQNENGNLIIEEGTPVSVLSQKYERDPRARKICLDVHGTACAICGIDFGKTYGKEFDGKIEVHHIVPLSKIRQEYVVDPVNDLIPVCPNCHTLFHSKKDGVYTVKEMRRIVKRQSK